MRWVHRNVLVQGMDQPSQRVDSLTRSMAGASKAMSRRPSGIPPKAGPSSQGDHSRQQLGQGGC